MSVYFFIVSVGICIRIQNKAVCLFQLTQKCHTFNMERSMKVLHSSSVLPVKVWMIWLIGALFYGYQFILRTSCAVMTDDLIAAFSIDSFSLGVLTAFYYNAYAAMQVPVGVLIDRFGTRFLITGAIFVCASGAWVFALSPDVMTASLGRLLMGVGSAFGYIGTLKIASSWFPPHKVGQVIGWTMVFGTAGATLGGAPYAYLMTFTGWRGSLLCMAALGVILMVLAVTVLRDPVKPVPINSPVKQSVFHGLSVVLSSSQVWIIGAYAALMYVPLASLADLWGTSFFISKYGIDRTLSSSMASMIYVGVALGSPVVAYLSDRFQKRVAFMRGGALLSCMTYIFIIYIPGIPSFMMYGLLLFAGMAFSGQILAFVLLTQKVPVYATGVSLGFMNMIVMLSGVIFEPLVGKILTTSSKVIGKESCEIVHTMQDFQIALSVIPISLLGAYILSYFIRDIYQEK